MATQIIQVHGNAVVAQDWDVQARIERYGWGASYLFRSSIWSQLGLPRDPPERWFHFVVPTAVPSWAGQRCAGVEVYFKSDPNDGPWVEQIDVWATYNDSQTVSRLASRTEGMHLAGDTVATVPVWGVGRPNPDPQTLPWHNVQGGLGVSVLVHRPARGGAGRIDFGRVKVTFDDEQGTGDLGS